jgi:hypothetical protein
VGHWLTRMRWRLRGALVWPLFAVLTLGEALVLGQLPISGDEGTDFVPGLLLAGVTNLVVVAVAAPLAGLVLRRRRPDLPQVVAADHAGAVLLALVFAGFVALGVAHRSDLREAQHDMVVQQATARDFVARNAPPEFARRAGTSDTLKLEDDYFRTCVPGDDPRRWYCVYVSTNTSPPGVQVDRSRESNASFNAPGGFR